MGDVPPRHAWLTEERLRIYPAALLFALVVAFVASIVTASGASTATGRLGGDFPAFFGAGRIVADGRIAELYDWHAQLAAQAGLHPAGEEDRFLAFAYPPFVALPYAALSRLGYVPAYVVHTLVMVGALIVGVLALRPVLPRVGRHTFAAFVLACVLLPLFRAMTGGQNTSLTLCLVALVWRGLHDDRPRLVGVLLGLLLFKPQLGLPLAGLVIVARRGAVLPTFLATAAGLWGLGALVAGPGWVGTWWSQIGAFHAMDQAVNAPNSVGLLGLFEAWIGPGERLAVGLGGMLSFALAGWLAWVWNRGTDTLDARMALTAPALVLVPPHAMHYDSGLVALAWLALADRLGRDSVVVLGGLYALSLFGEARSILGWDPMALVAVATIGLVVWAYGVSDRSSPSASTAPAG